MNKRGNLFEMLLLERGFPSWNESLNLSRREKGELSRARVFRKKLWPTSAAKVLRDTSLRDPSFIVRFTPVEAFFFPPNSFLFVYRDLKLIVFLPSYVLFFSFFFFFFFNCRLVARCVFHGRTIIRFLIELSVSTKIDIWNLSRIFSVSSMIATIKDPIARRIYDF